ncbi:MAG: hypothetical protein WCI43_05670, partial [Candidatus Firestonebacteria bacterium]
LIFGDLSIDYAFVPFGNLGDTHRFSLTLAFGAVQVPVKQAAEKQEPAAPAETKGAEDKIPQK